MKSLCNSKGKYGVPNRLWQQPETSLKPEGPRAHARSICVSQEITFASIWMKNIMHSHQFEWKIHASVPKILLIRESADIARRLYELVSLTITHDTSHNITKMWLDRTLALLGIFGCFGHRANAYEPVYKKYLNRTNSAAGDFFWINTLSMLSTCFQSSWDRSKGWLMNQFSPPKIWLMNQFSSSKIPYEPVLAQTPPHPPGGYGFYLNKPLWTSFGKCFN